MFVRFTTFPKNGLSSVIARDRFRSQHRLINGGKHSATDCVHSLRVAAPIKPPTGSVGAVTLGRYLGEYVFFSLLCAYASTQKTFLIGSFINGRYHSSGCTFLGSQPVTNLVTRTQRRKWSVWSRAPMWFINQIVSLLNGWRSQNMPTP